MNFSEVLQHVLHAAHSNEFSGILQKMVITPSTPARYAMRVDDQEIPLQPALGQTVTLRFTGAIYCLACGRTTRKSYQQGYCYPCSQTLARCDLCMVRPELCHHAQGTCREPEWGATQCMQTHVVYLANSSGLKVGITRHSQIPTRWLDQGASQALPIFTASTRYHSGLLEVLLARHVADKTDWRKLLKSDAAPLDLLALRDTLLAQVAPQLHELQARLPDDALSLCTDEAVREFHYPVQTYPAKAVALNLDKTPSIRGTLQGLKGQYWLLDCGVLNIRKYSGYHVELYWD